MSDAERVLLGLDYLKHTTGTAEGAADRASAERQAAMMAGAGGAGASASRYGAELGLQGTKYSADVGLEGIKFSSILQHKLGQAQLAETLRANKADELEATRRRALDAASGAVSAFLESQSLADARRLAGIQETRALLPSLIDPNRVNFGTAASAHTGRRFGLPSTPTAIQHQQIVNPSLQLGVGAAAGNRQITNAIEQLRSAGNA